MLLDGENNRQKYHILQFVTIQNARQYIVIKPIDNIKKDSYIEDAGNGTVYSMKLIGVIRFVVSTCASRCVSRCLLYILD